ncbi:hypothetical protein J3R83DRAFT_9542 [Lanmaoa asiatica]|nr:hypothetical protein J3R83DRAFT_9542 [Lanmaoa asiatica]
MSESGVFYVDGRVSLSVSATIVEALGLVLTAWRIYFRLKIGRFWWEDAWAAILFATSASWIITYWVASYTNGLTFIVSTWIYFVGFTCIVALARMSVLFSIIRIIHGSPHLLKFAYACVAFFVAFWLIQVVEKTWQCALDPSWHYTIAAFCIVDKQIAVFEFTTDCISVSILVVLPLCMLWKVKLPRRQRRMILSIFASSVVLAFAALFHTVGQILKIYIVMSAGWQIEIALSIIVCNLLVGVTYTYRFLLHDNGETTETTEDTSDDDDFTTELRHPTPTPATTLPLTTIDLEVSLGTDQQSSAILESNQNSITGRVSNL